MSFASYKINIVPGIGLPFQTLYSFVGHSTYTFFTTHWFAARHLPLMHKLQSLGVESYLLKWIHSYLTNRRQYVVLDGAKSSVLPVSSGVPQGSVLGPLLFIIYIDGVQGATLSNSTVVLYADDMVLYKTIQSHEDYSLIHNVVATWIEKIVP